MRAASCDAQEPEYEGTCGPRLIPWAEFEPVRSDRHLKIQNPSPGTARTSTPVVTLPPPSPWLTASSTTPTGAASPATPASSSPPQSSSSAPPRTSGARISRRCPPAISAASRVRVPGRACAGVRLTAMQGLGRPRTRAASPKGRAACPTTRARRARARRSGAGGGRTR